MYTQAHTDRHHAHTHTHTHTHTHAHTHLHTHTHTHTQEGYLESRVARLSGKCLVKIDVEVVGGLLPREGVYVCGDDAALGSWQQVDLLQRFSRF